MRRRKVQKTRVKLPVYLISLPVTASCVLRFFLLLNYTDKDTGYIKNGSVLAVVIYALLLCTAVLTAFYSRNKQISNNLLCFDKNAKLQCFSAAFLAVSFFIDFIHQCFNCYFELSKAGYVDYTYLAVLIVSALTALLSSFYFMCYSMTANGSGYDFRNLIFFHFVPIIWGIARLITMMLRIIDVRQDVESVLEFLMLISVMLFLFCFVFMLERNGSATKALVFFAVCTFFVSLVLVIPRLALILIGRAELLFGVTYTSLSYLALGIFAVVLINKRD